MSRPLDSAAASWNRPRFDTASAVGLAERLYGMRATAAELPSELDQNFLVNAEGGARFVLKIANSSKSRELLDAQNGAMTHLAAAGVAVPRVCADRDGALVSSVRGPDGERHLVRLLSWLPGTPFVDAVHTPGLLEGVGTFLGRMDSALADFAHPATHRYVRWDLRNASEMQARAQRLQEPARRRSVQAQLQRFERLVSPALSAARRGVIHNDANDYNLLVGDADGGGEPGVCGVIDFGDMVHTSVVCEPAIAMSYAMLHESDPVRAVLPLLRGYHRAHPLLQAEIDLLADLALTRLCVSVTISADERLRDPVNEYLGVTESHAWDVLDRLLDADREEMTEAFHETCREIDALGAEG